MRLPPATYLLASPQSGVARAARPAESSVVSTLPIASPPGRPNPPPHDRESMLGDYDPPLPSSQVRAALASD
jgi:hypothetical protein